MKKVSFAVLSVMALGLVLRALALDCCAEDPPCPIVQCQVAAQ